MKTYKLNFGHFLQIWVNVPGGKSVQVEFTGGTKTPVARPGIFRTDDVNIQAGIESHAWFNKQFSLAADVSVPTAAPLTVANGTPTTRNLMNSMQAPVPDQIPVNIPTPVPAPAPAPVVEPEPTPVAPAPAPEFSGVQVPDITNGQDAKRWLYENRKVPLVNMKNNEAILAAAAYQQVSFPDWIA
jgi:hypothetical protein